MKLKQNDLFKPNEKKSMPRNKGYKTNKKEENIQVAFSTWIKQAYPDVIFLCDLASGTKLTIGQATKNKKMRSSRAMADVPVIYEAKHGYFGLVIEMKASWGDLFNKDGSMKKSKVTVKKDGIVIEEYDHLVEQRVILERLKSKKYLAVFATGLECAKDIVNWYMEGIPTFAMLPEYFYIIPDFTNKYKPQ